MTPDAPYRGEEGPVPLHPTPPQLNEYETVKGCQMVPVALYSCHVAIGSEASFQQRLAALSAGRIEGCHNEGWGLASFDISAANRRSCLRNSRPRCKGVS